MAKDRLVCTLLDPGTRQTLREKSLANTPAGTVVVLLLLVW